MTTLPTVDFCGINVTRLVLGANPFAGFSHQSEQRDREMKEFHTAERIRETWEHARAAGINTMITNNETPSVMQAVKEYFRGGGSLQWITQVNGRGKPDVMRAIDEAVEIGCRAIYIHGAHVDDAYRDKNSERLAAWCDHARNKGIPAGVAGHAPEAHLWVHGLNIADFHAVCFFNCGSLHAGKGEKFNLADIGPATACIRAIARPCIGYKIMGAGRIDARMAFEYALGAIKPGDVVNVGMHRGDNDGMVEENAAMVKEILAARV